MREIQAKISRKGRAGDHPKLWISDFLGSEVIESLIRDDARSMSSEADTPSFQDVEFLEIATPSSVLSSTRTSISTSSSPGDTLTSLLLQIQHYHSSELNKLKEQVSRWKVKCTKLAKMCNDNANIAKTCLKRNQHLRAQVIKLKHQLHALQSPRKDTSSETSKIQAVPSEKVSPKKETTRLHRNQPKEEFMRTSRAPSKLTSKKSNKKIRYSEISLNGDLPKNKVDTTSDVAGQKKPIATHSPGLRATPDGNANSSHTPHGHGLRTEAQHVYAVPETSEVDDDVEVLEVSYEDLISAPAFTSTPVASQSQISSPSGSVQSPDATRLSLKVLPSRTPNAQAVLTTPMPKSESQYPVDLSSTQVKSPTFCGEGFPTPVSLNGQSRQCEMTKNVPTPQGGETSDMHLSDRSGDSEASMLLLGPNFPQPVPYSRSSPQNLPHHTLCPEKAKLADVSGQDNEFQSVEKTTSHHSGGKALKTSPKPTSISVGAKQQRNVESTSVPLQSHANVSRMPTSKKRKLDTEDETYLTNSDETELPEVSAEKENSPEGLDDPIALNQMSTKQPNNKNQLLAETPRALKGKTRLSRNLKQSKLTPNMFKPGMNKSARLMREYNGGSLVNIDSQSDSYINQAIEQSLIDKKEADLNGKDELSRSDLVKTGSIVMKGQPEVTVGFKKPSVPYKKQHRQNHNEKSLTEKTATPHSVVHDDSIPDHSESVDPINSPHDLNGTVDPLLDLTRLESEVDLTTEGPNRDNSAGSKDKKWSDRGPVRIDQESGLGNGKDMTPLEMEDDSCLDLFEEEEGDCNSKEELNQSADGNTSGYITNFDIVPKSDDKPNYKYTEVVRKHNERQKLKGFGCKECDAFYGGLPLTAAERAERMKKCSRHRAQFSPPDTPDHYWSVGFPDTQTCLQRGYIRESRSPERQTRKRRNNKYKMLFSGKEADHAREEVAESR